MLWDVREQALSRLIGGRPRHWPAYGKAGIPRRVPALFPMRAPRGDIQGPGCHAGSPGGRPGGPARRSVTDRIRPSFTKRGVGTISRKSTRHARSPLIRHHADEVIRKRERRRWANSRHVAIDAVPTLLPGDMSGLVSVATKALMVVGIGCIAPRIDVGLMACGAFDIALPETGALHEAQGLETDIGDVVLIARRRFKPVACAAQLNLSQVVKRTRIDRCSVTAGVLFGPRVAADTLNAGSQSGQVLAYGGCMAVEAGAGVGVRQDYTKRLLRVCGYAVFVTDSEPITGGGV
jgi:hypothetical protein